VCVIICSRLFAGVGRAQTIERLAGND